MNARDKGKRGERLWRDFLNHNGFTGSYRCGQQGQGGGYDNPDVVCPMLPFIHNEVKFTQNLNVREALKQSIEDASGSAKIPIVAWKKNNAEWTVTLRAEDFLRMLSSGSLSV